MALSLFLKQLLETDSVFGAEAKKLSGINDVSIRQNYPTVELTIPSSQDFVAITNAANPPEAPPWLIPGKYVLLDITVLIQIRVRVESVAPTTNGFIINIDTSAPGSEHTSLTAGSSTVTPFVLDGRIFAVVKDDNIARIAANGSTMFNLDNVNLDGTGGTDGSGVSQKFAAHYHSATSTVDGCTVEGEISAVSIGFTSGTSVLSSSLFWNTSNDGFQSVFRRDNARIIALCGNTLVTPLPIASAVLGDLSVASVTLDGTDITSLVTTSINSAGELVATYDTAIAYTSFSFNPPQSQTFTLSWNLRIGSENITPAITQTLTYIAPQAFITSFTSPTIRYYESFTTATITRSFPAGSPTSFVSTNFQLTDFTPGATSITFGLSDRRILNNVPFSTLTDVTRYQNFAGSVRDLTTTRQISVPQTFPIWVNSLTTLTGVGSLDIIGTFTEAENPASRGNSRDFTWPDVGDDTRNIKVFVIARRFSGGRDINFKANSSSVIGNLQSPISGSPFNVGNPGSTNTEQYDIYLAQDGQPGAVTLFVEFV